MTATKDDWDKPRSKGNHLTEAEIGQLRDAYRAGKHSRIAARDIQCSSRIAYKYYEFFRSEGVSKKPDPAPNAIRSIAVTTSRFYKSNFEV
jgi:hypothetical protein